MIKEMVLLDQRFCKCKNLGMNLGIISFISYSTDSSFLSLRSLNTRRHLAKVHLVNPLFKLSENLTTINYKCLPNFFNID